MIEPGMPVRAPGMARTPSLREASADTLFAAVYDRLKALASRQIDRGGPATLNTTGLVHELYVKVCDGRDLLFADPAQFFSYAAQAMRHILVDRARERLRHKRGGALQAVALDDALDIADRAASDLLELDDALQRLEREDPRAAALVSLHYFAGLSLDEIARQQNVSTRTLTRDWRFARAFLHGALA